ncbi:MAG: hypothetical protein CMH60_03460 [Myxococcales bacterium]|nr:hypothetical protein [Myxococcales bacterium]
MRIGVIIGRIGGIDGVALETEKWLLLLKKLGHDIHILTGNLEAKLPYSVELLPELDFHHPDTISEQEDAFYRPRGSEQKLFDRLQGQTQRIEHEMLTWLVRHRIDVILVQNASALPCHLRMGWAIKNILEHTGIPCVSHEHDYFWERGDRYKTPYKSIRKLIKECFPVDLPNVEHVVINSAGQKQILKRYGMGSRVVPNVMDFSKPFARPDRYNGQLRRELRLSDDDILLFQITRIVRRKGIETAIDLVHRLDDPRFKLLVTGTSKDDDNRAYFKSLEAQVKRLKLAKQVRFVGNRFANVRALNNRKKPLFSLSDAYAQAQACTYFSTYEGFGNAFVEAVLARRPIFVNNYKPVYWPDIGSKGFEAVMLNNSRLTQNNVTQIANVLVDSRMQKEIAEHNFKLGKKHFSFEVLRDHLVELF